MPEAVAFSACSGQSAAGLDRQTGVVPGRVEGVVVRRLAVLALALFAAVALFANLGGVAHAETGRRVALIVANAAYGEQRALSNPLRDGQLISDALNKAGFDVIELKTNLGRAAFEEALHRFQKDADGAQVAMIYYAGHGMERDGENWLIPTDAVLDNPTDLDYEAIRLDLLVHAVQGAQLRMVIIDACRDNPFGRGWTAGSRGLNRGLGGVDADDVFVLFAAAPGQVASDGNGLNSPFAVSLARHLPQPGLALQLLGGAVRDDVLKATGGVQRPFISASITGTPFYLVPEALAPPPPPPVPVIAAAPISFDTRSSELAYWAACCSQPGAGKADFEAYLQKVEDKTFPGTYSDIARRKLQARVAEPVAATPPPTLAATPAPAPLVLASAAPAPMASSADLDDHAQKILRILQGHAGGRIHVYPDLTPDLRANLGKWVSERCMAGLLGFFDQALMGNTRGNGIAFCADGIEINEFGQHNFVSYKELNGNVRLVDSFHVRFNVTVIDTNWFPGLGSASPVNFAEMLHAIVGAYLKG